MFFKKVDLRNREEMERFLSDHFRYYTMNSWNLSTTYANNVKIWNLGLTPEQENKALEIISQGSVYERIEECLVTFAIAHGWEYQVAFNGRSCGYLVLYKGGQYENGRIYVKPGLGIDQNADFSTWSLEELRDRVKLVQEFDELCDRARGILIEFVEKYEVAEEEVLIPKRVKVLKKIATMAASGV